MKSKTRKSKGYAIYLPLVPGKQNYCRAAQQRSYPQDTLILMDSTLKGICIYEFMYVYVRKQMLHYIDIHLEDKSMIPFFCMLVLMTL